MSTCACVCKLFFCVRGYVILLIDFLLYICWQRLHLYHLYELYKSLCWKVFYLSIPFDLRISLFWPFLILLAVLVICNLEYIGIKTNCLKSRMVCYALESFMFFSYIADPLNFPATHTFPWCWHHLTLPTLAPIWCIKTSNLHLHVCSKMYKQNSERVHINPKTLFFKHKLCLRKAKHY